MLNREDYSLHTMVKIMLLIMMQNRIKMMMMIAMTNDMMWAWAAAW